MLLCLGLALIYAIGLVSRSIWFDEAITLQSLSAVPFRGIAPGWHDIAVMKPYLEGTTTLAQLLDHYVSTDVHPPLYFLIVYAATLIFGTSLAVARGVSLVLAVASVALYTRGLLRLRLADPWILALVYGLSFSVATSAQDARGYALILLLTVAAWRLLTDMPETTGRARILREIGLGIICGALMLTHYFAVLLVIGLMGWHLAEALWRRTPAALVAPIVCTLVFLPWLPVLLHHLGVRPDQMTGFNGLVEWAKRVANLIPGQVFSTTHYAIPGEVQKFGRIAVLALMVTGAVSVLRRPGATPAQARFARIAVVVPALGISAFLAVSILLDRWFDTLRYFLFFAPFVTYLAARGALAAGAGLATLGGARLRLVPAGLLIAAEVAMLNFGWEANYNRGGEYYNTIADTLRETGTDRSLVVIDMGHGRGALLAAGHALPPETRAYLLDPDPAAWPAAAAEIAPMLETAQQVLLVFTIERGSMESDKALLYGPIVDALETAGFDRIEALPSGEGWRFYARWIKADGTG